MKCFSLFSGIGGFDLAAKNLGHTIVGACEIDKYARSVYARHFPDVTIHDDATKINPDDIPDFDLLVAGFPCQSFSVAGKRRGFEDTRGTLFFEIVRIAKQKRPQYMLLENVKGLLSHEGGKTVRKIYQTLDELGYDTESHIINTKDFLPQNRERIFIIATLRGASRREIFPLRESIERNNESRPKTQKKGERIRDKIVGCIDANYHKGHGSRTMIVLHQSEHQEYRIYSDSGLSPTLGVGHAMNTPNIAVPVLTPDRTKKRQNGRRFKEDGDPSFTLTVQDRHGIFDGKRIRKLTPTECSRLQGFEDDYTKGISDTQRYRCLGNAVSVPVVEHILSRLMSQTEKEF